MRAGCEEGLVAARCVNFARDLVNDPANIVTPAYLAAAAKKIAAQYKMKFKACSRAEVEKMKMGAFLAVAKGSDTPPSFITLDYNPRGAKETVVLVGKGLTFDSGGISLKPGEGMEGMKGDMAGGAAVLAMMMGVAEMRLKRRVVALVPATENMPSGHATRPGDIVKTMSGKTVEILNTDAEGRLILLDALTFAERYRPDAVFDFATLTGACVVALGHVASGLFGNNDALISLVEESSKESGERVWHMPIWDEYNEMMKGELADLKNTGGRWGGACSAAAFLGNFATKYPWVHLDIAGTAQIDKPAKYLAKGASGAPVRLMLNLLKNGRLPGK
jgi:leucyl aminopeptidase